ncbi:MAG: hypothetical protein HY766_05660 [candidate division NC10 bacterium]|nr:hypothetical protein [candidate division NC10 bacterium]
MDLGLKGKVAIVAASSRGMGKATAMALAAEGSRVTVWQSAFELNLLSTIRLVREVLPHMRKAGGGGLVRSML